MNILGIHATAPLVRVCAYCPQGTGLARLADGLETIGFRISHGMCPACLKRYSAELAALPPAEPAPVAADPAQLSLL
jgi:hypothetical protein